MFVVSNKEMAQEQLKRLFPLFTWALKHVVISLVGHFLTINDLNV